MSLQASYTPKNSLTAYTNAYLYVAGLDNDYVFGVFVLRVNIHRNSADGNAVPPLDPLTQIRFILGRPIDPADPASFVFPSMAQIDAQAAVYQSQTQGLGPSAALRLAVYWALAQVPWFTGVTQVP